MSEDSSSSEKFNGIRPCDHEDDSDSSGECETFGGLESFVCHFCGKEACIKCTAAMMVPSSIVGWQRGKGLLSCKSCLRFNIDRADDFRSYFWVGETYIKTIMTQRAERVERVKVSRK
jgi:hypothetical protein